MSRARILAAIACACVLFGGSPSVAQDFDARAHARLEAVAFDRSHTQDAAAPARERLLDRPKLRYLAGEALAGPYGPDPVSAARSFLRDSADAIGLTEAEIERLRIVETFRTHELVTVRLQQMVGAVPVYRGYIRVTVDAGGHVIAFGVDDIVSGVERPVAPRIGPQSALEAAYRSLGLPQPKLLRRTSRPSSPSTYFANPGGQHLAPIAVALQAFPTSPRQIRLAYSTIVEDRAGDRHEILVDADSGELLLRSSLTRRAAQARVWRSSPLEGPRSLVTFPDEWQPADGETTSGNNADAYIDANGDNEPDNVTGQGLQDGRAHGPGGLFDFPAPEPTGAADPRGFPAASVTNLFYFVNLAHDYFYSLGFDEAAGNFQKDNLGRGGVGGDAVLAEAFDPSFALDRFVSAADGMAPRLEVGFAPGLVLEGDDETDPNLDDVDLSYDGSVILHEYAHGVIDRLVGGPQEVSCLSGGMQSAALTEGWADYFAISFFDDPVVGAYTAQNPQRGLRRQSYAANDLTYEDFGADGLTDSHNEGEIWAGALWRLRARIGAAAADRLVLEGIRLTPCEATFVQARDAILMADQADGSRYRSAIWDIFAGRGLGYSAGGQNGTRTLFAGVAFSAAFDLPPGPQAANRVPRVTSTLPENAAVVAIGADWGYLIRADDPDGETVRFELVEAPSGMTIDFQTGFLRWTAAGFTGAQVVVAVTDGAGGRTTHGFFVRTVSVLTESAPLAVSGAAGELGFAAVDLRSTPDVMQVTLNGGSGDADLFLVSSTGSPAGTSSRVGTNEVLSKSRPVSGAWFVGVVGAQDFTGAEIRVSFPTPREVAFNSPLNLDAAPSGGESFFVVTVPANTERLAVSTRGADGNADLYLMRDQPATCQVGPSVSVLCVFEESSAGAGSAEILEVFRPVAGRWYFTVSARAAFSGLELYATTDSPETVRIVTGDGQSGQAGAALPIPPTVEVLGANDAPLRGLAVQFAVSSGEATVSPAIVPTGADGRASAAVRLGGSPGPVVVTATVAGTAPLNFNFNVLPFQPAQISPNGVVLATLTPFVTAISPGAILSIFGDRFTEGGGGTSNPRIDSDGRVSTELAGVCVEIGGERAPMLAVSRNQINAQAPAVSVGVRHDVVVVKGCDGENLVRSAPVSVPVETATPAFFNFSNTLSGNDPVAALHQDGVSLVGPRGTLSGAEFTPARRGEAVAVFAAGLGPTSPPVAPGEIPSRSLAQTAGIASLSQPVRVTIAGVTLTSDQVLYAGVAPCCAGLYQLNVIVPDGVPDGNLPIRVQVGEAISPLGPFLSVSGP